MVSYQNYFVKNVSIKSIFYSRNIINQMDHPVTIFWEHNLIPGGSVMIFIKPGRDDEESKNHFVNPIMIAGNPKSIFAKIKNTFGKIKNYIDGLKNDFRTSKIYFSFRKINFAGNNLKG